MSELDGSDDRHFGLQLHNRGRWPLVYSVLVDDHGLTEARWNRVLATDWPDVFGVVWEADAVRVRLAGRALKVDGRFGDWQAFGREIERRLAEQQSGKGPRSVAPQQVAKWLATPPDGHVDCSSHGQRVAGISLVSVGAVAMASLAVNPGLIGVAVNGVVWVVLGFGLLLSAQRVRADAYGVTMRVRGRPRTFAWSRIENAKLDSRSILARTTHDSFRLSNQLPGIGGLRQALLSVAAANQAGAELPSQTPVGETSLSRLGGEGPAGAVVERGLSRPAP